MDEWTYRDKSVPHHRARFTRASVSRQGSKMAKCDEAWNYFNLGINYALLLYTVDRADFGDDEQKMIVRLLDLDIHVDLQVRI